LGLSAESAGVNTYWYATPGLQAALGDFVIAISSSANDASVWTDARIGDDISMVQCTTADVPVLEHSHATGNRGYFRADTGTVTTAVNSADMFANLTPGGSGATVFLRVRTLGAPRLCSWGSPANGGSAITGYVVTTLDTAGAVVEYKVPAGETSATVPAGLVAARVVAVNTLGESVPADFTLA
jgi:hypothetical protein